MGWIWAYTGLIWLILPIVFMSKCSERKRFLNGMQIGLLTGQILYGISILVG